MKEKNIAYKLIKPIYTILLKIIFRPKVIGKENCNYKNRSGICLETGFLPDSVNQLNFASPILKANQQYKTTTIYKFSF